MAEEDYVEPTEGQILARGRLLDHVAWRTRPPVYFFRQLEDAIELAAAGKLEQTIELDFRRYRVREVIEDWELEEFVERFGEEPEKSESEFGFDTPF